MNIVKNIKNKLLKLLVRFPFGTRFYYLNGMRLLKREFLGKLDNNSLIKTEMDSKESYDREGYGELDSYKSGSEFCLYKGKIVWMSSAIIRDNYLKYLFKEVGTLLSNKKPIKILEVGCGNGINLVNLKERYGKKIKLYGIDISNERIIIGKKYFGDKLKGVKLFQKSITEDTNWKDNNFDLVFSMHTLEQIPHNCSVALKEIYRLAKKKIILIEPVFENGNPAQKLYLINSDINRILLKSIRDLHYKIQKKFSLDIQSSGGFNQSSLIVIKK